MTYRKELSSSSSSVRRMAATPTSESSLLSSSLESRNPRSSSRTSSSSMLVLVMVGVAVLVALAVGVAEGRPADIFPNFSPRSSALKALKDLDVYASQYARPRFGKRFDEGQKIVSSPSLSDASMIGADRWVLINRDRPLTKLTESYLREILADNEKSNSDSGLLGAA